jgi:hypothetical protein
MDVGAIEEDGTTADGEFNHRPEETIWVEVGARFAGLLYFPLECSCIISVRYEVRSSLGWEPTDESSSTRCAHEQ